MSNPNEFLKAITQVGVVVRDLEATIQGMEQVFGVKPDIIARTPPTETRYYRGKAEAFSCKMAIYKFANIDIELVEPDLGPNLWNEFLENGQHGLHHIRFSVDNFAGTIEEMQGRGFPVTMQGDSMQDGLHFAYFETEKAIDFVLEVFNEYEKP